MPDQIAPHAALPAQAGSRPAQLRALLRSPGLSFLMEAHSGLSAKIVEEAGFQGVWASGLAMHAWLSSVPRQPCERRAGYLSSRLPSSNR